MKRFAANRGQPISLAGSTVPDMVTAVPRLDFRAPTRLTNSDAANLRAGELRDGERIKGGDLTGVDLAETSFVECELADLNLTDAKLRGSRFRDCLASNSSATALSAPRTTWRNVQITTPRWGAAEFYDSDLSSVHIVGGKIDYLNLRGSRLMDVLLDDVTITELDLVEVRADRVAFSGSRVGTLDFGRAQCIDVDLRGCEVSAVNGLDGLAGVTIDERRLQLFAPLLATHLGITVE